MPAATVDHSVNRGLTYEYDQRGNWTNKVQMVGFGETDYVYDISDPVMYGTANNRLMRSVKSHVVVTLVQPPSGDAVGDGPVSRDIAPTITTVTTLETKWYNYNNVGNLTRVITKLELPGAGQRQYSSTWLTYAANGSAVTFAVGEEWDWDGDVLNQATNYNITYGRAFRYDSGRQRYLHRTLDPSALMTGFITTLGGTPDVWSDYSGDDVLPIS